MSTETATADLEAKSGFSIKTFKIVMLFVIFLCSLTGVLPKLIPAISRNGTALSFLNCFSAGIFLGMALFHIIPEGVELYEEWAEERKIERPFPLAYVLIFVGYLIVLAVDRVIAGFLLKLTGKESEAHIGHSHGGGDHNHDHNHTHEHDHDHDHAHDHKHDHGHKHDVPKESEGIKIVPVGQDDDH